jgi:hypothetical protein
MASSPLPPSPRREGGKKNNIRLLAPPSWGRGWGEAFEKKNKLKFLTQF